MERKRRAGGRRFRQDYRIVGFWDWNPGELTRSREAASSCAPRLWRTGRGPRVMGKGVSRNVEGGCVNPGILPAKRRKRRRTGSGWGRVLGRSANSWTTQGREALAGREDTGVPGQGLQFDLPERSESDRMGAKHEKRPSNPTNFRPTARAVLLFTPWP